MTAPTTLQSIAAKIRALLARTTQSGCTEAEALAAANKAKELLDKYQLDVGELGLREEGVEMREWPSDPVGATVGLARAIAQFTNTRAVRPKQSAVAFIGIRSDVDFAEWLCLSLETFVKGEVIAWMWDQPPGALAAQVKADAEAFKQAAYRRIAERLRGDTPVANALVPVKNQLIAQHPYAGMFVPKRRANWCNGASPNAYAREAGYEAGSRASFARPVGARAVGQITSAPRKA